MSDFAMDFHFGGGHYPNQKHVYRAGEPRPPGTTIKGRNCWPLGNGNAQAWYGMLQTAINGADCAMLIENDSAGIGNLGGGTYGTVFAFRGGSVVFIGSGVVLRAGTQIGVAVTSIAMLVDGSSYLLGLSPPPAPTIADSAMAGQIEGYISVVLTYVREATGEESNGSEPSNSLYLGLKKVAIPLPGAPGGSVGTPGSPATANAGVSHVRVYSTYPGFSTIGPWLWTGIESSALGTTINVDWTPGKISALGRLAPITYNVPPLGTHAGSLAGILIVIGTRGPGGAAGGFGLAPSHQATLGWDVSQEVFLKPGEPPTAVKGDSVDGQLLISCADSFHTCLYAPSPIGSILTRVVSKNVGFVNNNTWTTVGGEIWGVASDGRFVQSTPSGQFVSDFAYPIIPEILGLPSEDWVVVYDPASDKVVFANGSVAWAYDRADASGHVWSTALDLPAGYTAVSGVTADQKGYLVLRGAAGQKLFQFNAGSGGYSFAQVVPPFETVERGNGAVTEMAVDGEVACKMRLLTDLNIAPTSDSYATFDADPETYDFGGAGASLGAAALPHTPGSSWAPEIRWTTAGGIIYGAVARGYSDDLWIGRG